MAVIAQLHTNSRARAGDVAWPVRQPQPEMVLAKLAVDCSTSMR